MKASTMQQWLLELRREGDICDEGYVAAVSHLDDLEEVTLADIVRFYEETGHDVPLVLPDERVTAYTRDMKSAFDFWKSRVNISLLDYSPAKSLHVSRGMTVYMPHVPEVIVVTDCDMQSGPCLIVGDGGVQVNAARLRHTFTTLRFVVPPEGLTLVMI